MRMLVLGAGLQGSACAYDLLQNPEVKEVRLADLHITHLPEFLAPYSGKRLFPTPLDVRDRDAVLALMKESDAVMSAIPYYFNLDLAKLAVEAGTNFCDLGGNTEIVFQQKLLNDKAAAKGKTIVPDCGLAPGMVNILAQHGISQMDTAERVKIFVGGLPQHPEPPLNYQIVYSLEGVLDYYTTLSWVVRDGKRAQVKALSEREPVEFPTPVGTLEAFHTAGGLSTMAWRYEGKIPTMEYKTLRYPGHAHIMEAIRELGLLDLTPVDVKGMKVIPRDGKRAQVKALSEREPVEFPTPVGTLEAFHTAGGLSTMAWRYEGKIPTMEYKTLRYPGHAHIMEAIRELGLLDLTPVDVKGMKVIPRDVTVATMGPRLTKPTGRDLVALRVTVEGMKGGKPKKVAFELIDYYDEARGISAMMRTTGYSLSITGQMQARGEISPVGVHTPDECVPAPKYIAELEKRGVHIRETVS